mmetsp:Transcript_37771/g.116708  ORF Transcript_37771/g.116708 Transcript_37771/m.116708 type:complete len:241 (+) Transcript_37771:372-1094(+)
MRRRWCWLGDGGNATARRGSARRCRAMHASRSCCSLRLHRAWSSLRSLRISLIDSMRSVFCSMRRALFATVSLSKRRSSPRSPASWASRNSTCVRISLLLCSRCRCFAKAADVSPPVPLADSPSSTSAAFFAAGSALWPSLSVALRFFSSDAGSLYVSSSRPRDSSSIFVRRSWSMAFTRSPDDVEDSCSRRSSTPLTWSRTWLRSKLSDCRSPSMSRIRASSVWIWPSLGMYDRRSSSY